MAIKRPRRENYSSEVEFLLACLHYLDLKHPGREGQRKRVIAWMRWSEEHDPEMLRARIGELVALDDWTPKEAAEFDRLAAIWRARARRVHPTPDRTEGK